MKPLTLLIPLLLSACNQSPFPGQSLTPNNSEAMHCPDSTLDERRAYVEGCVGQDCFEESVAEFCEEMK